MILLLFSAGGYACRPLRFFLQQHFLMHSLMSLYQRLIFTGLAFNSSPVIYALLHDDSVSHWTATNCSGIVIDVCIRSVGDQISSLLFNQGGWLKPSWYLFRLLLPAEFTVNFLLYLDYSFDYGLFIFIDSPIFSLFLLFVLKLWRKKPLSSFVVLVLMLI